MSTSKLDTSGVFDAKNQSAEVHLSLSSNAIKFRKNGIEFLSSKPVPVWSEMTIDIQTPEAKKVSGSGVVVAESQVGPAPPLAHPLPGLPHRQPRFLPHADE